MSKYNIIDLWDDLYPNQNEVIDYAGRKMLKSACSNPNSKYHPTIDHIRPLSKGGLDILENIAICHYETNQDKGNIFATWIANNQLFQAKRIKGNRGGYIISKVNK